MPELVWDVEAEPAPASPGFGAATSTAPLLTFRDTLRAKAPVWLQTGLGEKILYAIGVHIDGFADVLTEAVKARFPGLNSEALPYIGRERRIRRGRAESEATYATRLRRWLDDHATRGGPYAMLAQLFAHYADAPFQIDLVYISGRRFRLGTNGEVTMTSPSDLHTPKWAIWTLFYDWPVTPSPTADALWGAPGRTWGDGKVWGSSLTVEEVTDLRLIPREWNAAHCLGTECTIILLTPDVQLWGFPEENTWGMPGAVWGSATPVRLTVE